MITVNDKLKLFTKRIVDKRQHDYDEKVHLLEDEMVIELQSRRVMLEKDRVKYETALLKGIKAERKQRLSNARSEKKRRLLLKRKNMIETLLEGVKKYTRDFVASKEYPLYMENTIRDHQESIRSLGEFDIYLNKTDYNQLRSTLKNLFEELHLDCREFKVYDQSMIGGAILLKGDGKTRIDLSLDSVIEDNKTYMGQLIYAMLEEAGELHEQS